MGRSAGDRKKVQLGDRRYLSEGHLGRRAHQASTSNSSGGMMGKGHPAVEGWVRPDQVWDRTSGWGLHVDRQNVGIALAEIGGHEWAERAREGEWGYRQHPIPHLRVLGSVARTLEAKQTRIMYEEEEGT